MIGFNLWPRTFRSENRRSRNESQVLSRQRYYGCVLLLRAPSETQISKFLSHARNSGLTYPEVGASAGSVPTGYSIDHNRIQLGLGTGTWQRAVEAIRQWKMFEIDWLRLFWPFTPIAEGEVVAVLARFAGVYWLNACRIVYTTEEKSAIKRYGFAYGTLDDHAESGEERFTVEWNTASDEVWYDILAFSRPHQSLPKIGYVLARRLQRRFAADSQAAMVRAVGWSSSSPSA